MFKNHMGDALETSSLVSIMVTLTFQSQTNWPIPTCLSLRESEQPCIQIPWQMKDTFLIFIMVIFDLLDLMLPYFRGDCVPKFHDKQTLPNQWGFFMFKHIPNILPWNFYNLFLFSNSVNSYRTPSLSKSDLFERQKLTFLRMVHFIMVSQSGLNSTQV